MRKCGVFADFAWNAEGLDDFGDFNLIYGWNGTGKSTISRIFRALERQRRVEQGEVELKLDGSNISGDQFADRPLEAAAIKVFNQDFVKESIFRTGDGEMDPIYVIGSEGADAQRRVAELNVELQEAKQAQDDAQAKERAAQKDCDDCEISTAKDIKDSLGGRDDPTYRNYNRGNYSTRADKMIGEGDAAACLLPEAEKHELDLRQRERLREEIDLPEHSPVDARAWSQRVSGILQQTVPPAGAIQALLDNPDLARWIEQGRRLHSEDVSGRCLYCDQPISQDRIDALERHFNDELELLTNAADSAIADLHSVIDAGESLLAELRRPGEIYSDLRDRYDDALRLAESEMSRTREFVGALVGALTAKRASPHERISMPVLHTRPDSSSLTPLLAVVRDHNKRCGEFSEEVATAKARLEANTVASSLPRYESARKARDQARLDREAATSRIDKITAQIAALNQETRDHRLPAERLNRDLREYLGHGQLQLEVREHGYVLKRNGEPGHDPSEGEMTAISLLYFLRSLDSDEFDLKRGVVVLDDPVSSLDANALFMAAAVVRERTFNVGQLFIFTHNFDFFREMKNWLKHLNSPVYKERRGDGAAKTRNCYMIERVSAGEAPRSRIQPIDPLLRDYESDYHYLFSYVRRAVEDPNRSLERNYGMPNAARRLLEAFLTFKRPGRDRFWTKLNSINEIDSETAARVGRFLDTYSHDETIGGPEIDPTHLAESSSVLKDVLRLMRAEDKEHFEAMADLSGGPLDRVLGD